jgi:hypothetical protein
MLSKHGGMEILSISDKYGPRRQVSYRIGPLAQERLEQVARLFNLKGSEYAKAIFYRDLGIFTESLDLRRKRKQKAKRSKLSDTQALT